MSALTFNRRFCKDSIQNSERLWFNKGISTIRLSRPQPSSLITITRYDVTGILSTLYHLLRVHIKRLAQQASPGVSIHFHIAPYRYKLPHRTRSKVLPLCEEESSRLRQINSGPDQYKPP